MEMPHPSERGRELPMAQHACRSRRNPTLAAAGLTTALLSGIAFTDARSAGAQQTPFRSSVDVIAVDVQVVDKEGHPVGPLDTRSFEVSINKQKRKVISAQFVRHTYRDDGAAQPAPQPDLPTLPGGGRTFILAVDNGSFDVGSAREAMEAVKRFVGKLEPRDRVGLYVYPSDIWMPPTTERAPVQVRLDRVVGERQPLRSHYN